MSDIQRGFLGGDLMSAINAIAWALGTAMSPDVPASAQDRSVSSFWSCAQSHPSKMQEKRPHLEGGGMEQAQP